MATHICQYTNNHWLNTLKRRIVLSCISINYFSKLQRIINAYWIKVKLLNLASNSLPSLIIFWVPIQNYCSLIFHVLFYQNKMNYSPLPICPMQFSIFVFPLTIPLLWNSLLITHFYIFIFLYPAALTRPSSNAPSYENPSIFLNLHIIEPQKLFTKRMKISSLPIWWLLLPEDNPLKATTALFLT